MAYEIPGFSFTLPAGQDFRTGAGQFRFVNINSVAKAVVPALGGQVVGVRQMRPNLNEATTIVGSGVSFVEAAGAITAGQEVTCDATGRAVVAAAGQRVHGIAFETASGAGIQIAVYLSTRPAVV